MSDQLVITVDLVQQLIAEQFPAWQHLPVKPVAKSGWDNRTFHLGETMSVRLPSHASYAPAVAKEQMWLPRLAKQLPIPISKPIALGQACEAYPLPWSVYRWLEGENADTLPNTAMISFAREIATFLKALHQVNTVGAPEPGTHNFYRGAAIEIYDAATREAITALEGEVDTHGATAVWEQALRSRWTRPSVWIHGDFAKGNILVKEGRLAAVIDFGGTGIGDPACDLVIAWRFLNGEAREAFRKAIALDPETWERARGWAIWKALINIAAAADKNTPEVEEEKRIVRDIIAEYRQMA